MLHEFGSSHKLYKGDFARDPDVEYFPEFQRHGRSRFMLVPPFDLNEPFADRPTRSQASSDEEHDRRERARARARARKAAASPGKTRSAAAGSVSILSFAHDANVARRKREEEEEEKSKPVLSALRSGSAARKRRARRRRYRVSKEGSDPSIAASNKMQEASVAEPPSDANLASGATSRTALHSASASFAPKKKKDAEPSAEVCLGKALITCH